MTYPVTLCCVSVAKLLVLDRLVHFAKVSARWALCLRLLVGVVVIGNAIALCASTAASVYFARGIGAFESLVTTMGQARVDGVRYLAEGTRASAVLVAFEAIMLLLIVIAFSVVGILSKALINNAMGQAQSAYSRSMRNTLVVPKTTSDVAYTGRQLKRQILGTCGVAFASFLVRAVFSVFFTITTALQQSSIACPDYIDRCSACYNVFSHMLVWYLYSPDVVLSMVLVTQPFAVLVLLWGMTTGRTFDILKRGYALP
jgi:hypothetical protein